MDSLLDLDLDLVRAVSVPAVVRDDGDNTDGRIGTLFGHSTVFNQWYEIDSLFEGTFLERVDPDAADDTLANDDEPKVLFNHGRDMSINNKVLGVHEKLIADKTGRETGTAGVYYQVPLLDTSYNRDLLPGLKANAYGSSFMFRVTGDMWNDEPGVSDHNPKGLPERTITGYRLFEHGPVTFPANPAATSGARAVCSMTDDYYRATLAPDAFEALAARTRTLRNAEPSSDAKGASDEQRDGTTPNYGPALAVRVSLKGHR